jgi:hypothetical protein
VKVAGNCCICWLSRRREKRHAVISRMEESMDPSKHEELKTLLRNTLKDHQREGLNMIGSVDQLVLRLTQAVEELAGKKSA